MAATGNTEEGIDSDDGLVTHSSSDSSSAEEAKIENAFKRKFKMKEEEEAMRLKEEEKKKKADLPTATSQKAQLVEEDDLDLKETRCRQLDHSDDGLVTHSSSDSASAEEAKIEDAFKRKLKMKLEEEEEDEAIPDHSVDGLVTTHSSADSSSAEAKSKNTGTSTGKTREEGNKEETATIHEMLGRLADRIDKHEEMLQGALINNQLQELREAILVDSNDGLASPVLPISDDLLVEIFSQSLPVKSLLICKVVCKSWYSLINSPQFVKRHFLHSSAESSLLAIYKTRDHRFSATRFIFNGSCVSAGQSPPPSSKGLCLQVSNSFSCSPIYEYGLHLCHALILGYTNINNSYERAIANLATGEVYRIPLVHEGFKTGFYEIVYDASSGSYKVFSIERFCQSAYVFTLGNDGSWKKVIDFPPFDINGAAGRHPKCILYVFPSLHGVPFFMYSTRIEQHRAVVFVAEKESFMTIDFDLSRTRIMHLRRQMTVAAYQGSLYLFDYNMDVSVVAPGNFGVWVMNDFENKVWVKEEKSFNLKSVYPQSTTLFEDGNHIFIRIVPVTVIDDGIVMKLECSADKRDYEVVYAIYDPIEKVLEKFVFRMSSKLWEGT